MARQTTVVTRSIQKRGKLSAVDLHEPDWLELPIAKKEIALHRAKVLDDYLRLDQPGLGDANRAISSLGVSRSRFFQILREWRSHRSLVALVPHARTTRKAPASNVGKAIANKIVARAVGTTPERSPAKLLSKILSSWPVETARPAQPDLRNLVHQEIAKAAAGFSLVASGNSIGTVEKAFEYGEVLVVDHTAPKNLFVSCADGAIRPTITLAIDLFTRTVAGVFISLDAPGATQAAAALADAVAASAGNTKKSIKPRVMLNMNWNSGWRALEAQLMATAADVIIRRTPKLNHGISTYRLIGSELGRLSLAPRASHDITRGRERFDTKHHFVLTFEEATKIIRSNVAIRSNELLAGIELAAIDLTNLR